MNINEEISTVLCEMTKANEWLIKAEQRRRDAGKEETAALNAVNAAQTKLDEIYSKLKRNAPRGTKWNGEGCSADRHHGVV